MRNDSKHAQAKHHERYNQRSRSIRQFQTGALKMGEQMPPNDVKKNEGKIEECMVRAEKIVDSPNAWCVSEFWRPDGQPA